MRLGFKGIAKFLYSKSRSEEIGINTSAKQVGRFAGEYGAVLAAKASTSNPLTNEYTRLLKEDQQEGVAIGSRINEVKKDVVPQSSQPAKKEIAREAQKQEQRVSASNQAEPASPASRPHAP